MKIEYSDAVNRALANAPTAVQKAFFKQAKFLEQNLHHPSLRAKKYDEASNRWQARVNKDWRFYFTIVDDTYRILKLIPIPSKPWLRNALLKYNFREGPRPGPDD